MEGHRNSVTGQARIEGVALQAGDIQGGVHIHSHAPALLPVPQQLPPAPAHLLGRAAELSALDAELSAPPPPGGRCLVLTGPPGIGKSALAGSWLRTRARDFPDGVLYADLRGHAPGGPADPGEVLGAFLRALAMPAVPADLHEAAALWRSVTAGRRFAVLLDSAATAAQVRPLLPGAAHSVTVVTGRTRLTGLGIDVARFFEVGLIDRAAATELLARRVGADRVAAESPAADQVVARCAGLPLALCVAGARMAARPRQPLAATAEALSRESDRLDALRLDGERAVHAALAASYRGLEPAAARLYRLLGLLPVPEFTPALAGAAAELPLAAADLLLDALGDEHLLEQPADGRYRFHDLVRLHARECGTEGEPPEQRRAAARRVAEHLLATATATERLISPSRRPLARDYDQPPWHVPEFDGEESALRWLDAERGQLAAALRAAVADGRPALVWQLADAMWPLFLRLRAAELQVEAHESGLAAARADGVRAAEQRMLTSGGHGLRNAGRPVEAARWYGEALELARAMADPRAEANAQYGIGQSHRLAGELASARRAFEETLRLREQVGHPRGVALARIALGEVALAAADLPAALAQLDQAERELTELGDHYEAARALALTGQAHLAAGRLPQAGRTLDAALAAFRTARSTLWEARTLHLLGELAERDGDPARARQHLGTALALYRTLAAPDAEAVARRLAELPTG
ncbi:tetratricopeptide repeat protein [Streptomyces sp. TLI_171]|uniref:tetratricopeptide repeat protein n=1 Tax=Streptomyces sp. TLI_171 TaxID=1938859 RepID=UPI000C198004|nr:tetratricopeptide repeat protein [Streptomyces sp. TLI_171]RKE18510.1 ATP/maltotriose-dependent transcriptional regulator MalT [Streptomyces sp. TLI_171]